MNHQSLSMELEMPDQRHRSFALIRFNHKTYESGGVMAVVRGRCAAEKLLRDFEWGQTENDRYSGWRYFLEESDLEPGIDAQKATKLRQMQLDLREAKSSHSQSQIILA
jgi:hypothetical protein